MHLMLSMVGVMTEICFGVMMKAKDFSLSLSWEVRTERGRKPISRNQNLPSKACIPKNFAI